MQMIIYAAYIILSSYQSISSSYQTTILKTQAVKTLCPIIKTAIHPISHGGAALCAPPSILFNF